MEFGFEWVRRVELDIQFPCRPLRSVPIAYLAGQQARKLKQIAKNSLADIAAVPISGDKPTGPAGIRGSILIADFVVADHDALGRADGKAGLDRAEKMGRWFCVADFAAGENMLYGLKGWQTGYDSIEPRVEIGANRNCESAAFQLGQYRFHIWINTPGRGFRELVPELFKQRFGSGDIGKDAGNHLKPLLSLVGFLRNQFVICCSTRKNQPARVLEPGCDFVAPEVAAVLPPSRLIDLANAPGHSDKRTDSVENNGCWVATIHECCLQRKNRLREFHRRFQFTV